MTPTNSKSLLQFIFDQMEKLDKKKINCQEAQAQAKLAKEANNVLNYEIKRADMLLKLRESEIEIRDIEIKAIEEESTIKKNVQTNPYGIIENINKNS